MCRIKHSRNGHFLKSPTFAIVQFRQQTMQQMFQTNVFLDLVHSSFNIKHTFCHASIIANYFPVLGQTVVLYLSVCIRSLNVPPVCFLLPIMLLFYLKGQRKRHYQGKDGILQVNCSYMSCQKVPKTKPKSCLPETEKLLELTPV